MEELEPGNYGFTVNTSTPFPYEPFFPLKRGDSDEDMGGEIDRDHVKKLQVALKRLGYMANNYIKQVNGVFGGGTERAVKALQYDLVHERIRGKDWNSQRIYSVNGEVDQKLAEITAEILDADDSEFLKVPYSENAYSENQKAVEFLDDSWDTIIDGGVPPPFLKAILKQETNLQHYDRDGFVYIGCDVAGDLNYVYKSRGWGMGQYTIRHHPPTVAEAQLFVYDVMGNLKQAIQELRDKFEHFIVSGNSAVRADERMGFLSPGSPYIVGEPRGNSPLMECKFPGGHSEYMRDCENCVADARRQDERYPGATVHKELHRDVPVWSDIPCDWPVAVRRYNGSGPNSYAYRAEVLWHMLGRDIR